MPAPTPDSARRAFRLVLRLAPVTIAGAALLLSLVVARRHAESVRTGAELVRTIAGVPGAEELSDVLARQRAELEGDRTLALAVSGLLVVLVAAIVARGPGSAAEAREQAQRERELEEARAAAEGASAAKSEFLANMSHEIRTPMSAILGYADLLAEDDGRTLTGSQRLEYLDIIRHNGEHLLAVINDVLDISKIEARKMTVESIETHPVEIMHDVLSLMRVKARAKGIELDAVFETGVPEAIETDPVRLRQILMNLVGNAIKFTEVGGVTLRAGFDAPRGRLRFEVHDTGIGLIPEQMSGLFEAFRQADSSTTRRFGGSGLGLRISKRLAGMLGGDITVRSRAGEGSVFTLVLGVGAASRRLISAGDALAIVHSPRLGETEVLRELPRQLQGLRLLLVEDGPDNQRLITFHLRRAGAVVTLAENGRIALGLLTEGGDPNGPLREPPPFDLIVSDMQMPEMDGYDTVRRLRGKGCRLPIVALTAHAMSGDEQRCLEAGCDAYLPKPIEKRSLLSTCVQVLGARGARGAA